MSLDALLQKLRDEAQKHQASNLRHASAPLVAPWPPMSFNKVRLWASHAPANASWLCLANEELIEAAYLRVLGRRPDPEGLRYALDAIANGMPRVDWLMRLRLSP